MPASNLAPRTFRRLKEEQILAVLREAEAGATTADLCRRYGVSQRAFYRWKVRFRGLLGRLRELEDELRGLREVVGGFAMENQLLKQLLAREQHNREATGGGARRVGPAGREQGWAISLESAAWRTQVSREIARAEEA